LVYIVIVTISLHRFKNERELKKGPKYTMEYSKNHAALTVHDTETQDGGKYRCEADNRVGRVETGAKLIVSGNYRYHTELGC
jgi:hypothetical protein